MLIYRKKNKEGKITYLGEMGFLSFSDTMNIWSVVERDIESQRQFKHVGRQRNVWVAGRSSKDLVGHFSERTRVYLSLYSDMAGLESTIACFMQSHKPGPQKVGLNRVI